MYAELSSVFSTAKAGYNLANFNVLVVGSLIAYLVNWSIEKKRDKLKARRDLISGARRFISLDNFNCSVFYAEPYFMQLKPYLSKNTIKFILNFEEIYDSIDDISTIHDDMKITILEEITTLEQKWKLI